MVQLLLTNSDGTFDITQLVPSITWSGEYTQCGRTLEFSLISSQTDKNIPIIKCELGNSAILKQDNDVLFDGYIFTRQKNTNSSTIDVTCFDRGIYLKRNEASYKFNGDITAEAITRSICDDFGFSVGSLAETNVKIKRNFIGATLYSIIQTVYSKASEATGKNYHLRFTGDKLNVFEKTANADTLIIQGGSNLISASTTESIEGMVNQVKIYDSDGNLIDTKSDAEAINKFGTLQSYLQKAEGEDYSKIAKKLLDDNGPSQKISVENLGNTKNLTGNIVKVQEPYTGLVGIFYIDSDTHTWKNGLYLNKLVLNFKEVMDKQNVGSTLD